MDDSWRALEVPTKFLASLAVAGVLGLGGCSLVEAAPVSDRAEGVHYGGIGVGGIGVGGIGVGGIGGREDAERFDYRILGHGPFDPYRQETFDTSSEAPRPLCERDPIPPGADCPPGMVIVPPSVRLSGGSWASYPVDSWTCQHFPAFCMDKYEVTIGEYRGCLESGRCPPSLRCLPLDPKRARHPVECATYYQAAGYCAIQGKRLPTAQQWTAAAAETVWDTPDELPWSLDKNDLYSGGICINRTQEQGSCEVGKSPLDRNWLGIYDMAANAREWCRIDVGSADTGGDHWSTPLHGLMGGLTRTAEGGSSVRDYPDYAFGIRCARELISKRSAPRK